MKYTVNLSEQDIIEIIAEKFNTEPNNVTYSKDDIKVNFEKDVKIPEKHIGFV